MPPASNVDLSKILASSTLVRPRSQQVINSKLRKDEFDMPWEGQQLNWRKASARPYSGFQGSDITSLSQGPGEGYTAFHRFTPSQLNHPGIEKGSRAYASWLQWWKSTVNSDDFFKYLSTQDTDFLSVIFHFYDSDFGDSEVESMRTAKMETRREREKKIAVMKKEKEEYIPGFWNVKTVTLGGLGKDPEIEEENEFSDLETPHSQAFSQSEARSCSGTPRISLARIGTDKRFSLPLLNRTQGYNRLRSKSVKLIRKQFEAKDFPNAHKLLAKKLDSNELTGDESSTSGYCSGSVENTTTANYSVSLRIESNKKPSSRSFSSNIKSVNLDKAPKNQRKTIDTPIRTSSYFSKTDQNGQIARITVDFPESGRSGSSPRGTTSSPKNKSDLIESRRSKQDSERENTIQERLEVVWRKLKMPDSQKLDLALKYSGDEHIYRLPEIVASWERVTEVILKREALMTNLEIFEKEASDPNRFFEKGQKGSSATRLREARKRAGFYKKLETLEMSLTASLKSISNRFSDVVTYDGRAYTEKMSCDKIEMLYYLQQERRCMMLKDHGYPEPLEAFLSHGQSHVTETLPPIHKTITQLTINSTCLSAP